LCIVDYLELFEIYAWTLGEFSFLFFDKLSESFLLFFK